MSSAWPAGAFAKQVVTWQLQNGRHGLPWQASKDPYRVWLSEIMLQQTQVVTVIPYFDRFVARFPDVENLAHSTLDAVLGLWSGLGYYSRARNLHRCAQQVVAQHNGVFPRDAAVLAELPGIGRSTAAAIASLCFGERVAILDANVKRVLTRATGFDGDLAMVNNVNRLWEIAASHLPVGTSATAAMPSYTQGMMDLGATVCLPKKPDCVRCPLRAGCVALSREDQQRYPVRSRKLKRSSDSIWMLLAQSPNGAVWLSRRPTPGVWAGLFCLPLFASEDDLRNAVRSSSDLQLHPLPVVKHVLTHKDLHLHTWHVAASDVQHSWGDGEWIAAQAWPQLGLPAPIRKLLQKQMPALATPP